MHETEQMLLLLEQQREHEQMVERELRTVEEELNHQQKTGYAALDQAVRELLQKQQETYLEHREILRALHKTQRIHLRMKLYSAW